MTTTIHKLITGMCSKVHREASSLREVWRDAEAGEGDPKNTTAKQMLWRRGLVVTRRVCADLFSELKAGPSLPSAQRASATSLEHAVAEPGRRALP